jgi:hypothetical protein
MPRWDIEDPSSTLDRLIKQGEFSDLCLQIKPNRCYFCSGLRHQGKEVRSSTGSSLPLMQFRFCLITSPSISFVSSVQLGYYIPHFQPNYQLLYTCLLDPWKSLFGSHRSPRCLCHELLWFRKVKVDMLASVVNCGVVRAAICDESCSRILLSERRAKRESAGSKPFLQLFDLGRPFF